MTLQPRSNFKGFLFVFAQKRLGALNL